MAGSDTTALPGFLGPLVQGVGVTLTDVNDVVFRLAFFEREYQFFSQSQLVSEVSSHYTGQALKQLYVLALGLDVLGNPYGLVVGIKKGVEDLLYEPFHVSLNCQALRSTHNLIISFFRALFKVLANLLRVSCWASNHSLATL